MAIEKRGDGQWRARLRPKGQKELSATFNTKAEAQQWENEMKRKIRRGEIDDLDPTTQTITVKQAVKSYSEKVLPTQAREGKGTAAVHLKQIEAYFGRFYVSALRSPAINDWARSLSLSRGFTMKGVAKKGLGAQSVIHHLNTLSSLIRHAQTVMGVHMPSGNPVKLVSRPPAPKARDRVLRPGEFDLLIRAAQHPGDGPCMAAGPMVEPMIRLAIATSMRQGELLALRWDWVDLKDKVAKLSAESTKNGESRSVALLPAALEVLRSLPRDNGRVFGNWKDASSFSKPWQRTVKRARWIYEDDCKKQGIQVDPVMLQDLRFHDLRHHATTELFNMGMNPMHVMTMTGHKSVQMLKRYTHINAKELAAKFG
jgi:integrase